MSLAFSGADLAAATSGVLRGHALDGDFSATGVSIDTRNIAAGDVFIALVTEQGDGHRFVADAFAAGAACAMVHHDVAAPDGAALVQVEDTLNGLTALGAYGRARFQGRVAAVTGSVGKTTTKEMLRAVLGASGATHAAQASYNNHWGVPLTLARMPANFAYGVIEIGMNHAGEIAPLARLAAPHVAIITTVAAAHIGHLGSLEAIADEKASILQGLAQGGVAVLPAGHALLPRLLLQAGTADVRLFGGADLHGVTEDAEGSDVVAEIGGTRLQFRVAAPGRHMVMNALAALTAADALGADIVSGAAQLASFTAGQGRGARRAILGGDAILLDESYNASAASIRAALDVLRMTPARRRIAVLGDMLELGDYSASEHIGLAPAFNESADLLYACGPWMKKLYDVVEPGRRGAHAADSAQLALHVAADVRAGDAVLVKGSFGSRMRLVVDALEGRAS